MTTTKTDCNKRHAPLWGSLGVVALVGLAMAGGGWTLHGRTQRHDAEIQGVKENQREIKRDVAETRRMVFDLWKSNGNGGE